MPRAKRPILTRRWQWIRGQVPLKLIYFLNRSSNEYFSEKRFCNSNDSTLVTNLKIWGNNKLRLIRSSFKAKASVAKLTKQTNKLAFSTISKLDETLDTAAYWYNFGPKFWRPEIQIPSSVSENLSWWPL